MTEPNLDFTAPTVDAQERLKALHYLELSIGFVAKEHDQQFPRCPHILGYKINKWLKRHNVGGKKPNLPKDIEYLKYHFGCTRMAGLNTAHGGYGLCDKCEKYWKEHHDMTDDHMQTIADDHKESLQQHAATVYQPPNMALSQMKDDAEASQRMLNLYDEINMASIVCQQIISALDKKDPEGRPMTMWVKGELEEMDDKTMAELAFKGAGTVGKMKELNDRIIQRRSVPEEKHKIFMSKLAALLKNIMTEEQFAEFIALSRKIKSPYE